MHFLNSSSFPPQSLSLLLKKGPCFFLAEPCWFVFPIQPSFLFSLLASGIRILPPTCGNSPERCFSDLGGMISPFFFFSFVVLSILLDWTLARSFSFLIASLPLPME